MNYVSPKSFRVFSIGDKIECGNYKLHSRFENVVNFSHDIRLVSLVNHHIVDGPTNIVTDLRISEIDKLTIESERIVLNIRGENTPIVLPYHQSQRYNSTLDSSLNFNDNFENNLICLKEYLIKNAPVKSLIYLLRDEPRDYSRSFESNLRSRMKDGVDRILSGNIISGVRTIRGLGIGLTPAGDDFIVGVLSTLQLMKKSPPKPPQTFPLAKGGEEELLRLDEITIDNLIASIAQTAIGDNLISAQIIRNTAAGAFTAPMKDFMQQFIKYDFDNITPAIDRILTIGASSGADTLVGFCLFGNLLFQSEYQYNNILESITNQTKERLCM